VRVAIRWLAWGRRVRGDVRDLSTNTQKPPPWPSGSRKILRGLSEPYVLRGHTHQGAASIGAHAVWRQCAVASELLRQADIAMYQVCRGNALCFFDPKMQTAINDRAQLEADLRQALITQQLVLHFQPQASLQGEWVRSACCAGSTRRGWFRRGSSLRSPKKGILIPHRAGAAQRCSQLARWQDQPQCRHLQLSVNVSARQFRQSDFVHQVDRDPAGHRRTGATARWS
jgi:predicted signal transduction protein with EAL and GGDEF domain